MDRDGTLIRDAHYLKDPQTLEIIKVAGPALKKPKMQAFCFSCIPTSRGLPEVIMTGQDVYACNAKMHKILAGRMIFLPKFALLLNLQKKWKAIANHPLNLNKEMIKKYDLEPSSCWVIGDKWIDPKPHLMLE